MFVKTLISFMLEWSRISKQPSVAILARKNDQRPLEPAWWLSAVRLNEMLHLQLTKSVLGSRAAELNVWGGVIEHLAQHNGLLEHPVTSD